MGWNYRVLAHEVGKNVEFKIHEVYYNEDGIPDSCTVESCRMEVEDINDFKLINKFSRWLTMYDWRKNNFNALWYQADSMYKEHKFSTIYKKFLKSRV